MSPRGVALLFQFHKNLEAVTIKGCCGKLCGPTLILSPSQMLTQVRGALVCCAQVVVAEDRWVRWLDVFSPEVVYCLHPFSLCCAIA